jgi:small-conductance mechanosensitive channel
MTRWLKVATAVLALGGLPAMAAETSAQAKDRAREDEIHARMKAREMKNGKFSRMNNKERADQTADATRAGGARAARTYHGAVHSTRKGINHLSKKTEKATK